MFCPNCGAQNQGTGKFCRNCGKMLPASSGRKESLAQAGDFAGRNVNSETGSAGSVRASGRKPVVIILVISAVIVVAFIFAVYVTFLGKLSVESGEELASAAERDIQEESSADSTEGEDNEDAVIADEEEELFVPVLYNPYDFGNLDLEVWDGSVAEDYAGGDGTESNPYEISNGAELALFAKEASNEGRKAYYVLTSDLLMNDLDGWENWLQTPPENVFDGVAGGSNYFQGSLDGQGYIIYGLYSQTGLLNCIGGGAKIQNLNLAACVSYGDSAGNVGGVVGTVKDTGDVSIESCLFNGIVSGQNAGGIVGAIDLYEDSCKIFSCKVRGTVEGVDNAGGIVGKIKLTYYNDGEYGCSDIRFCTNHAAVTSAGTSGGIIGEINGSGIYNYVANTPGRAYVYYCGNTGEVKSAGASGIDDSLSGGIVGDIFSKDYTVSVEHCFHSGSVSAEDSAGSIVGNLLAWGSISLADCSYSGNIRPYGYIVSNYDEDGKLIAERLVSMTLQELADEGNITGDEAELACSNPDAVTNSGKLLYKDSYNNLYISERNGSRETWIARVYDYDWWGKYWDAWPGYTQVGENILYEIFNEGLHELRMFDVHTHENTLIASKLQSMLGEANGSFFYITNVPESTNRIDSESGEVFTVLEDSAFALWGELLICEDYVYAGQEIGKRKFDFYDLEGNKIRTLSLETDNTLFENNEFLIHLNGVIYSYEPYADVMNALCDYTGDGYLYDADDQYIYVNEYVVGKYPSGEYGFPEKENGDIYSNEIYRIDRMTGEMKLYDQIFIS